MDKVIPIIQKWYLSSRIFVVTYLLVLVGSGLLYLFSQFSVNNSITDSLFLGLLFGSSLILLVGIKWIQIFFHKNLEGFYDSLESEHALTIETLLNLVKGVFKNPYSIMSGLVYGIAVGLSPFLFDIWEEVIILKIELALFLFIVNFLTGSALFSLVMLFKFLYNASNNVRVNMYDRYNNSARFITDISKRASIIASLYVAFSITSIYFSELPINTITISYSIFSALIILTAYVIPMIPIRNRILNIKKETINTLSFEIQKEFDSLIKKTISHEEIDTSRYEALLEMRSKVNGLPSFPIGLKGIWNALSIIGITLLPILIELLLEKI